MFTFDLDMEYKLKEIYYTIQGEGFHVGRPAVFCRFSGCNLWSGREEDRSKSKCSFCDTDFLGMDGVNGGKYSLENLVIKIKSLLPQSKSNRYVVFTGGEPALQLDSKLVQRLQEFNIEVAVETNGTKPIPSNIDWVCVSPKANTEMMILSGDEIKIVVPQNNLDPKDFEQFEFSHFYLQPMDGLNWKENVQLAINYCKLNPQWRLSVQIHKYLGIY